MPKVPLNPSPDGNPFQIRPGVDPLGQSGWRGVNSEDDPGSLDSNEFQRLENMRIQGKNLGSRPGAQLLFSLPSLGTGPLAAGQVMWMREAPVDNPRVRLWFTSIGCLGASIGTGGSISHLDPSESPNVQTYARFFAATDRQIPMAKYGDKLIAGDGSALREVIQITAPSGVDVGNFSSTPPSAPLFIYTGFTITALLEFDGKLFVGLSNDAAPTTTSKIAVWDGISSQDDVTGLRVPLAFGIWRNTIVVGFDATGGNIRWRPTGAVGAAWTSVALAGYLTSPYGNAMQERGPNLYIASGTNLIHQWDGTSLTLARTVGGSCDVAGATGCTGLTLHNGLLYYLWNVVTTLATHLGRHDSDSTAANEWVDDYLDVTASLNTAYPSTAGIKRGKSIASYRGQIYMGASHGWIAATKENDIKGAVEAIVPGATTTGFDIVQLLRYP